MRIPVCLLTAGVTIAVVLQQCSVIDAAAVVPTQKSNVTENSKPNNLFDALKEALKDRALIESGPENEPKPRKDTKKRRFVSKAESKSGKKDEGGPKGNLLRQELAKETQDNCLAKLICGVQPKPQVQQQKTQPFSPVNDYAYLVKEFFEVFGGADAEDFKEQAEKANDEGEEEDDEDNAARSSPEAVDKVNITGSIEEVVSTSTTATIDYVTTGATITDLLPSNSTNIHKVTLEELVGDVTLTSEDVQSIRKARNLLKVGDLNKSAYVQRKIRELRLADSDSKKLRIAGQIVTSIRQPRQCKQFSAAASEILSTCPLTTEVVRYFNSNLKNGSQIALVKTSANATEGGLVLLNDQSNRPFTYFLDNSPLVANSKISTDLKNPTVPERFVTNIEQQIYEHQSQPNAQTNQVSIAQPVFPPASSKPSSKATDDDDDDGSNEEDEDEENADDDEEDEEEEGDDEEEEDQDDEVNDEESNVEEEEDFNRNPDYQVRKYKYNNFHIAKRGKDQQDRKWKVNKKPKKTKKKSEEQPQPKPGLPPGIIKVYGIPQPSFDNEFSHISGQIGRGPVVIFDQDDYDSQLPHPGRPPLRQTRPSPRQPSNTPQRNSYEALLATTKLTSNPKVATKPKTKLKIASSEEEDEEEEDEEDEEEDERSRIGLTSSNSFKMSSGSMEEEEQRGRPSSSHYLTSSYGAFPAPRAEEYYRNGLPPRPRPVIPSQNYYSSADRSRSQSTTQVRGRLNFRPNTPGSGLIRPYVPQQSSPTRGSYFSY